MGPGATETEPHTSPGACLLLLPLPLQDIYPSIHPCPPPGREHGGGVLCEGTSGAAGPYPPQVVTALVGILLVTTVGDILGNFLVIISVFKSKQLRKAGKSRSLPTPVSLPRSCQQPQCRPYPAPREHCWAARQSATSLEVDKPVKKDFLGQEPAVFSHRSGSPPPPSPTSQSPRG